MSREEQKMYIKRITSMNVPFSFKTAHTTAEEIALLDSGATENFIDEETWKRMKVGRRPLVKPIKVYNVDGTENKQGEMTHYCRLRVIYNDQEDLQEFYITNLGKDRLILGYPFLRVFNPRVDWRRGKLLGKPITIQSAMYKHLDRMIARWQIKAIEQLGKPKEHEAIYVRKTTISQEMAREYHQKEPIQLHDVPKEYQKYKEVFSEDRSSEVPSKSQP